MAEAGTHEETDSEPKSAAPPRSSAWIWAALAAYVVFRLTIGVVRLPLGTPAPVLLLASAVVALGSIGLPIALLAALARAKVQGLRAVLLAGFGLALWFGLLAVMLLR